MKIRIELSTDIATIGVWDPAHERHDLKRVSYNASQQALQDEARAGRLFFINTGADGGFLTEIYVDEWPEREVFDLYDEVQPTFLIESQSGFLIAGGLEDFVSSTKQITSDQDRFPVAPGRYELVMYRRIDDEDGEYSDQLRQEIGAADYDYYLGRMSGCPWGCLPATMAVGLLYAKQWLAAAGTLTLGMAYVLLRQRMYLKDKRFQEIIRRIEAFETRYPPFLYVLCRVAEAQQIQGGWYDLK